jgi:excisionase family DNA binding protein
MPPSGPKAAETALPDYLPLRVAARLIGVSDRTLGRRVASGEVPAPVSLPGLRHRRFRRADIMALLAGDQGDQQA